MKLFWDYVWIRPGSKCSDQTDLFDLIQWLLPIRLEEQLRSWQTHPVGAHPSPHGVIIITLIDPVETTDLSPPSPSIKQVLLQNPETLDFSCSYQMSSPPCHTLSEPPSWGSWGLRWYSSAGKESQPTHNIDHRRHQQPQQGQQSESKAEASVGAGQVLLLWCGTRSRRPHPSDRDWWLTPSFSLSTFTSRPQISPDLYCSGTSSKKLSAVTGGYVLQSCHVFFPTKHFWLIKHKRSMWCQW